MATFSESVNGSDAIIASATENEAWNKCHQQIRDKGK